MCPQDVYVVSECSPLNRLSPLTLELLGLGGKLASSRGDRLCAVILGNDIAPVLEEFSRFGVDEVFYADDVRLSAYNPDTFLALLAPFFNAKKPRIILAGHTSMGQDLAPRLAFSLQAGLVTDCVGADTGPDGEVIFTKPIYGGNALAKVRVSSDVALATVRARVGEAPAAAKHERPCEIASLRDKIPEQPRIELKGKHLTDRECSLEEAPVVVTGGRGMGGPQGFAQLEELAKLLGGAVGASRPPVDSGWAPNTCQVGITGKVVAPDIYIAVAISGSSQHLSGMSESRKIVAINKDPEAYIFKVSDYGVVGNWKQVLPAFAAKIRELVSE